MGIVQQGSGAANARQPIGTGPYRLSQFVQDDRLVLTPFGGYYGGVPRQLRLVLKVVPTTPCGHSSCAKGRGSRRERPRARRGQAPALEDGSRS
jgi:MarR-like DNA-binding transcriptional regulator SgrR of sgrS sRNA